MYSNNNEHSLTQTTNLSNSNTPVANFKSEIEDLKGNQNSQMSEIFDKKELVL